MPYTIEVWDRIGGELELHLARIYPLSMASAAFEAACLEWPTNEVTLRDRARIVRKQEATPRSNGEALAAARRSKVRVSRSILPSLLTTIWA